MTEINYKSIYEKLVERYPQIAKELTTEKPKFDVMEMLKVYTLFCQIKGIHGMHIRDADSPMKIALFVAVFVKRYDPAYFDYQANMRRGLRNKIATLLNCHRTKISHILANVKIYMKAYKSFKKEVEYIHELIRKELDESQQERPTKPEERQAQPEGREVLLRIPCERV